MDPSVFVHPHALCETDKVGARTRIWAFAHVLPGAVIGADCNICDHAFVEGAVRVGSGVTIKNGVQLFDGVIVDDEVFLGRIASSRMIGILGPRSRRAPTRGCRPAWSEAAPSAQMPRSCVV